MSREQRLSRILSPHIRENDLADLNCDHDNNNSIYDDTQNNNTLYDPSPSALDERVPPIGADWTSELSSPDGPLPGLGYSYTYRQADLVGQTSIDEAAADGFQFDDEFMKQWLILCDLQDG